MLVLYFVFAILVAIITILVIALFLPAQYHIEKTAFIKKPVSEVMNRIADLNYYAQWNPWQQKDTQSKFEITGAPKKPGHKYAWTGKKTGSGSLTLRAIDAKHIHFDLQFIKPWKAGANDNWLFEEWGNDETKVTWQNHGDLPYPMARLMGRMLKKSLGKQFTEGLNNLKVLCEGKR